MSAIKEPIAIIGFDLEFPGEADSPENFYEMLKNGRSAHGKVPTDRYNVDAFYHPDSSRGGSTSVQHGHFLTEDVAAFDAPFFSVNTTEAACMDPQQRKLLEVTYKALENAGLTIEAVSGTDTSVYVGCYTHEYDSIVSKDPEVNLQYVSTGVTGALMSNRLSWFYNMKGPSLTVETACSGSLTACHLACQSLSTQESSMAIVGGCNLMHSPEATITKSNLGLLSPDGKCYSFDHRANGYARGEGFAVIVLKRLSDAVRDGNTIRALIRNTGCNQDGRSPGITQPTQEAQVSLINRVYDQISLDRNETRYFEAHGTGTAVGDPIELGAIDACFSSCRTPEDPMYVGSVKTNIGHLEGAAGMAGLLKTVYSLERSLVPPNLWFEKWNPRITIDKERFRVATSAIPWPSTGTRRASLNSFGIGGANAHIILEDAGSYLRSHGVPGGNHRTLIPNGTHQQRNGTNGHTCTRRARLFVLSTFDQAGTARLAKKYGAYLRSKQEDIVDEDSYLDDLSYTLSQKRSKLSWRTAIVVDTYELLVAGLDASPAPVRANASRNLGLVFTGQGAQWQGMGRELMAYKVFRQSVDAASKSLAEIGCSWSAFDQLSRPDSPLDINKPELSQPLVTVLQVALVELLASWSVEPVAVVGHSSGEIAAAFAAGAISRETAWAIAYYRGVLSASLGALQTRPVGMAAASLGPEDATAYLQRASEVAQTGPLTIACFNSPESVTVSGDEKTVDALVKILEAENVFCRKLRVSNAYHSHHMQPIADEYRRRCAAALFRSSSDREQRAAIFYSSLTGEKATQEKLRDPEYWVNNLLSPVQFATAIGRLLSDNVTSVTDLLEIGPHAAMKGAIRENQKLVPGSDPILYNSVMRRGEAADRTFLDAVGWLFGRGHGVDVLHGPSHGGAKTSPRMLTDLPGYQFDHSKSYWNESRMSTTYRTRKYPRHDLLGAPAPDWNPRNAMWVNWIRLKENPWIKDHVVTGSTLYPGAGMLVMAIEASRQLANPAKKVEGFRLKDVSFHAALSIPEDEEGLETRFYLRPQWDSTSSKAAAWNEFEVWSYQGQEWTNHCRGLVHTEYTPDSAPVDGGLGKAHFEESCRRAIAGAEDNCLTKQTGEQMYESLRLIGLQYGPTFRTLSDTYVSPDGSAVMTLTAPDLSRVMPEGFTHPHLIHPTTLDGAILAGFVGATMGGQTARAAVPSSIQDLWIADIPETPISILKLSTSSCPSGLRQKQAQLVAINPSTRKPVLTMKNLTYTAISTDMAEGQAIRSLCFNVDWKPDSNFVAQENALAAIQITCPQTTDSKSLRPDLATLCYVYLKRYLLSPDVGDIDKTRPHYRKYLSWVQHIFGRCNPEELIRIEQIAKDDKSTRALESRLENANSEAKLTVAIGRALPQILKGEIDALQIIFGGDNLAENLYRYQPGADYCLSVLSGYVQTLAHQNPDLKILEIGAGTAATTTAILDKVGAQDDLDTPHFGRYDFTDISAAFLSNAKERFQRNASKMSFRTLNIENDPLQQGFEAGSYDVIAAADVLHATKSMKVTLENARKLLKPGGKLILYEITNMDNILLNFSFGLLSGWWLHFEPDREMTPLMSVKTWGRYLQQSGYSGVDMSFDDSAEPGSYLHSIMVATNPIEPSLALPDNLPPVIIVHGGEILTQGLSKLLQQSLQKAEIEVQVVPMNRMGTMSWKQKLCIFLPELATDFLAGPSEKSFHEVKRMCSSASGLMWITQGGGPKARNPKAEMVVGLARTMRRENPTLDFVVMSTEEASELPTVSEQLLLVFKAKFLDGQRTVVDNTFYENHGVIYVPRVTEAKGLSKAVSTRTQEIAPQLEKLGSSPDKALVLRIATPGDLSTLRFAPDPVHQEPLAQEEIEVRVKAAGQNLQDLLMWMGESVGSDFALETAGVVTRIGQGAKFKVGDKVCGLQSGTLRTHVRASHDAFVKIPGNMSWTSAASMPMMFMTAFAALYDHARMQQGEKILIHDAAGGVGQACIQLAQLARAEIFATAASAEQLQQIQDTYGIPHDHIFFGSDLSFAAGIIRMTEGRGVDVIVNSLSGAALEANWECIAPFGRFIHTNQANMQGSTQLGMEKFKKNVSFRLLDIGAAIAKNKSLVGRTLGDVMRLYGEKKIKEASPVEIFPFSKIQDALQLAQNVTHSGKIVLELHEDDEVMTIPVEQQKCSLDPNATYIIVGGFGGLGRSIATWMADRGAKNLLMLSRSGANSPSARALLADLESRGISCASPPCDISDHHTVKQILGTYSGRMPPIKGCIQGAMVLKDALFENMSLGDYNAAVKPKVDGSMNLHELLPSDLDFFVLLSSFMGIIGNPGQANYGVGNTYLDALARHRVANGQKAVSLDLSIILSIGYVAERLEDAGDLFRTVTAARAEEFHAVLDEVCNFQLPATSYNQAQVVFGCDIPQVLRDSAGDAPVWTKDPMFRAIHSSQNLSSENGDEKGGDRAFGRILGNAASLEEATDIVKQGLVWRIGKDLNTTVEPETSKSLHEYGVDSLVALKLRSWILNELRAEVAIFDIMGNTGIESLAGMITKRSTLLQAL